MVWARSLSAARFVPRYVGQPGSLRSFATVFEKIFGLKSKDDDDARRTRFGQYEIVRPGRVSPMRPVPAHVERPPYADSGFPPPAPPGIHLKNEWELDAMRRSGEVARSLLDKVASAVQPGITTDELDAIVHEETIRAGAYPSPLNYRLFPKSVCTSVNNVVCHGIPDDRPLADGDIISVDVTVYLDGFHGDCCDTFLVGDVDQPGRKVVDAAKRCRDVAIAICGPGVEMNRIGETVEDFCEKEGFTVLPMFAGHGIGTYFHGLPEVLNFRNDSKQVMREGMTFTIEPAVGQGSEEISILTDRWTAVTKDDSRAAQFEHTIAITPHGAEILTPY